MKSNPYKNLPPLTAKRLELVQVESEIEKLLDTLTDATPVCSPTPIAGLRNWTQSGRWWTH